MIISIKLYFDHGKSYFCSINNDYGVLVVRAELLSLITPRYKTDDLFNPQNFLI